MYYLNSKTFILVWILKYFSITCIEELGENSAFSGEAWKKDLNKCDGNPVLTDSPRGRTITLIASTISGMTAISNVDSAQYRAACWLIYDDWRQMDPFDNTYSVALVQRYILAVLYYSTQGSAWDQSYDFISGNDACEWNYPTSSSSYDYSVCDGYDNGAFCDESGNICRITLCKC